AYDKANRLTSKWGEAVSVGLWQAMATPREYYRYDTRGNLVETIDANGARTLSYYDDLNRRIATVAPAGTSGTQGVLSTFAYDVAGNLTASRT
uniref:RHS repeat domain-containing protein n=54 Tax=Pseudomonadota TaxID=1224 RepID=UPI0013D4D6AD